MNFIGINLGTVNSSVSIRNTGGMKMVYFKFGNTIPSCVCYKGSDVICGYEAKSELVNMNGNVVYDLNRLLGRKYSDSTLHEDSNKWLFKVVDDGNNSPIVQIEGNKYSPLDILSVLLEYLIKEASRQLGSSINKVVISVPHYFHEDQQIGRAHV